MKRRSNLFRYSLLVTLAVIPAFADAHPGHAAGAGFVAGAWHPLTGVDHLLALLAVGALGWRMGGAARVTVPMMFLCAMQSGMLAGLAGLQVFAAPLILCVSIVIPALLAIRPPRAFPTLIAVLAGSFAFFHGHAHGSEATGAVAPLGYAAGLGVSSACLLALGSFIAALAERRLVDAPLRR
jgi:urease accessory protein